MRILLFFFAASLLFLSAGGCTPQGSRSRPLQIGVDATWRPLDFGAQNPYVNGFVEELLLDFSAQAGLNLEKIPANSDSLFQGLKAGRYEAVLSSLSPYEFNKALYDFSYNFLDIGPVLVLPEGTSKDLEAMSGEHIGVLSGDPAVLLLQKFEGLIVRNYPSIPTLLDAVVSGELEGAVLDRVAAGVYVGDLYSGKLKLSGVPLTEAGLRLIALKDKHPFLIAQFNKSLALLKKKKRLQALQRKWQLGES